MDLQYVRKVSNDITSLFIMTSTIENDPLPRIKKKRENFAAKWIYRPLSEPIAIFLAKFGVSPNTVTTSSIFLSVIAGLFFIPGQWRYSVWGGVLLQLAVLLDHVDGSLARHTGNLTPFGHWWDNFANKLIKFFVLLGMSYGAYAQTGQPLILLMGSVAIFNITFSSFIAQLKKDVPGAEFKTIARETTTSFFPASLIVYGIITLGGLTNLLWFPLAFLSTFGFIWIKQLLNVYKASQEQPPSSV